MNTPDNLLPFDLTEALANPDRVITRDGRKVSQLVKFNSTGSQPLYLVLEGIVYEYCVDGSYICSGHPSPKDLFLLPETKVFYHKVFNNGIHGTQYSALDECKQQWESAAIAVLETRITGNKVEVNIVHHY